MRDPEGMKLLVCVKQVPDADAPLDIAPDGRSVICNAALWRMNRFDAFAVEEALRIKAAFPGTTVEAITVGPAGASSVLRRALAMGADGGIHILLPEGEADPFPSVVASLIAACVRDRGYDLIFAGVMAEDTMHAQTGPFLAERLGIPCATAVMAVTLSSDAKEVRVEREREGGHRAALMIPLPALIAVQSGINRPRYPALSHVLRSRTQPLETVAAGTLPAPPRRERIVRLIRPEPSGKTLFLTGTAQEKADRLAALFRERALL